MSEVLFQRIGYGELANPGDDPIEGWGTGGWGELPWGGGWTDPTPSLDPQDVPRIIIKEVFVGDIAPIPCRAVINGRGMKLSNTTIVFRMQDRTDGTTVVEYTVPDGDKLTPDGDGRFVLQPDAAWHAVAGNMLADIQVSWPNGTNLTFGTGSVLWRISERIGPLVP